MKAYEERKAEKQKADAAAKADPKAAKATDKKADDADNVKPEIMNDGMMMGVVPDAADKEDKKKLMPVTPWGRYVKVLLSSSEFLFID